MQPTSRDTTTWRELFRSDDLMQAQAVATSIASMEYDVRVTMVNGRGRGSRPRLAAAARANDKASIPPESFAAFDAVDSFGDVDPGDGPLVIEVPASHWPELADVLDEIIREQSEFDARVAARAHAIRPPVMLALGVAGVAEFAIVWRWVE